MSDGIRVKIKSGSGNDKDAQVTGESALLVQDSHLPPPSPVGRAVVFRQYLTTDGTAGGTNDMQVSSDTDFYVPAHPDFELYISTLSFVISDGTSTLNKFGNITALTNGCQLTYFSTEGEITIHDALKTNWDFVRLCQGNPAFGDAAGAFLANNVSGNSEGYIPTLDFKQVFGMSWGIHLRKGTADKIILKVRDTTTGVDQFDCIAFGFTRR